MVLWQRRAAQTSVLSSFFPFSNGLRILLGLIGFFWIKSEINNFLMNEQVDDARVLLFCLGAAKYDITYKIRADNSLTVMVLGDFFVVLAALPIRKISAGSMQVF